MNENGFTQLFKVFIYFFENTNCELSFNYIDFCIKYWAINIFEMRKAFTEKCEFAVFQA